MLKPHIVDKIVDPNTNKVYYESKKEESEQLVSTQTVSKMKDLMYNVVNGTDSGTTGGSYKIEGFSLAKLTISSLIEVLMKESKIEKNELIDKIYKNELKILEMLDYKPQIFEDNNIHQLSYILLDLFIKKYSLKLNLNEEKKIHLALDFINKSVEFSDKILFKYFPIDKAMLSFYSSVEYFRRLFPNNL